MLSPVRDVPWRRLSALISERIGLHFPQERLGDLRRGLAEAARELGFDDAATCADRLLSAPPSEEQVRILASHLTVGETYFWRDPPMFQALAEHVLPDLIRARRGGERRLRFWSAACSSGEEPYSLAILLHQLLPDLRDWRVTILATDVNAGFLRKGAAGVYGPWSFRDVPPGFQERYFTRTADGRFAVTAGIKQLVTFARLNLADDIYPALATGTNAMDLILCRNVLIYFTPAQIHRVVAKLRRALVDGGWLAVSPSEASQALFPQFAAVNHLGAIFYRKGDARPVYRLAPSPDECPMTAQCAEPGTVLPESAEPPAAPAAAEDQRAVPARAPESTACSLARARANEGDLAGALAACDRWLATDKLDPVAHYLRAAVVLEQGDSRQARASLRRAAYLDPGFVLAHFALGNLARNAGKPEEARQHFANALDLLRRLQPGEILPESDGLTAGRLAETVAALGEPAP